MSDYMAQYVSSTDPRVLAAIESNSEARRVFHEKACAFAQQYGSTRGAYASRGNSIDGIVTDDGDQPKGAGRWKKVPIRGGHAWTPWRNNPVADEMGAIRVETVSVPGVPDVIWGPYTPSGSQHVSWPRPFAHDGVAYCGVGFVQILDDGHRSETWGPQWSEITGGAYRAAMDAYNASLKED